MYYRRGYKQYLTIGAIILMVVVILISGCEKKVPAPKSTSISNETSSQEKPKYDTSFLGVVKEINDIAETITLYNIDGDMDVTLNYTGGTDVRDQYEQIISMGQIALGEMVDAGYVFDTNKLMKMQISSQAWEYQGVDKIKIDKSNKIMEIANQKYQYTEKIVAASQDGLISLIDLNDRDELTVKGVAGKIYSVIVTKGHGYIRLTNYDDFIGGTIEVGYGIIVPVVDDMLIVAREGSYKVTMENGELVGSRNITVTRDKEIVLDMGDFHIKKERVGLVNFAVSPEGADVYVNGALIDYSQPLELNYGEHSVVVTMAGYEDFTGILTVAAAYQTININLAEASAEVVQEDTSTENQDSNADNVDDTSSETDTGTDSSSGTDITETDSDSSSDADTVTSSTGTTKIDSAHTITVGAPVGAKVYLNGTLKGTAPVTFTKEIGSQVITFSKDGYITKSYTIEVIDDSENVSFSFPDMIKSQSE